MDQEMSAGDFVTFLKPIRSGSEYIDSLRDRNLESLSKNIKRDYRVFAA